MKAWIKRTAAGFIAIIILLFLCFFLFRNTILQSYIQKTSVKFKNRYGAELIIGNARFSGITGIALENICILPENKDTFLRIDSIGVNITLRGLLSANPDIKTVKTSGGRIRFIARDSIRNNYSFLFRPSAVNKKVKPGINFSGLLGRFINTVFGKIPDEFMLEHYSLHYVSPSFALQALVPALVYRDEKIQSSIRVNENDTISQWFIKGSISRHDKTVDIALYKNANDSLCRVPFLKTLAGLYASVDTFRFHLSTLQEEKSYSILQVGFAVSNVIMNHWRISKKNVGINTAKAAFNLRIGPDYIQADSSTTIILNDITLHPFLNYTHNPGKTLTFIFIMPATPATNFFTSLPEGLFPNTKGIEANGSLAYRMGFFLNAKQPDSLKFSSLLSEHNFEIVKYGKTNLSKMNGDFKYVAYEKGYAADTLLLAPGSNDFTPLNEISPSLQASVMTSEDGNFYYHKGFNPEMFRRAIAINLSEKRFVRGGSTISMQLVKNVFLNREKTISRKLEEALIVWLIEHNRLTSKERIYEVYLNIIEWGPGVYGITQASEFYFNKKPNDLTLEESIFLAMIVPFPKWFKYQFDENGKLRESANGYYQLLAGHLVKKGMMTEEQKLKLKADVQLTGRAKSFLKISEGEKLPEVMLME